MSLAAEIAEMFEGYSGRSDEAEAYLEEHVARRREYMREYRRDYQRFYDKRREAADPAYRAQRRKWNRESMRRAREDPVRGPRMRARAREWKRERRRTVGLAKR